MRTVMEQPILDTDFTVSSPVDEHFVMSKYHFHNVFEIYFSLTGGLRYFVNNGVYPVEKNDLFIFNNNDLHRICLPPEVHYERMILVFNPDYIRDLCTGSSDLLECFTGRGPDFNHRLPLSPAQAREYTALFREARTHMQESGFGEDVLKRITLAKILVFVNLAVNHGAPSIAANHDAHYARIEPILSYINGHIGDRLTLDVLEDQFYLNKYYLCKLFRKATGFTVNEYIVHRRIIKATELLRKGFMVSRVSEMTGFKNDCHFITTFKKMVGTTPKQYAISGP